MPHIDTSPAMGERWPRETPGGIQIWSVVPGEADLKGEMRCEMVLCVDGGAAWDVKWMPLGAWDEVGGVQSFQAGG